MFVHSQIDMELLISGQSYEKLPNCFVIFICDFDPFGLGLYRYSFQSQCQEMPTLTLGESQQNFEDEFVRKLQTSIRRIKKSREMEGRFMTFEELLADERREGKLESKAESVLELLQELGEVPKEVEERIFSERDLDKLKQWFKLSLHADSMESFLASMDEV